MKEALAALTHAAQTDTGNLLALSVDAIRARATVGEVSLALEHIFGRHRAQSSAVMGIYGGIMEKNQDAQVLWQAIKNNIADFAQQFGRQPRIMVVKLGQDGHDRGAKVIATAFADLGFDVDIGPLFQTPEEAARQAIENDVHALGISTLAAGHKTLVPAIITALKEQGAQDIVTFVSGVIPQQDHAFLYASGVKGIYNPGTPITSCATDILEKIRHAQTAKSFFAAPKNQAQ